MCEKVIRVEGGIRIATEEIHRIVKLSRQQLMLSY